MEAFCAGAWSLYWTDDTLYWIAKPTVAVEKVPNGRRLHNDNGPALTCDVENLYFVHGVMVPEKVVMAPKTLTIAEIEAEANSEVRRIMIERYGQDHYLMESNAKEIHRDDSGVLYRKEIAGDEALVMVKLLNSTPEPDGSLTRDEALLQFRPDTAVCESGRMISLAQASAASRFKTYFQRVPPDVQRAKQAVAWMNHKPESDYAPAFQS